MKHSLHIVWLGFSISLSFVSVCLSVCLSACLYVCMYVVCLSICFFLTVLIWELRRPLLTEGLQAKELLLIDETRRRHLLTSLNRREQNPGQRHLTWRWCYIVPSAKARLNEQSQRFTFFEAHCTMSSLTIRAKHVDNGVVHPRTCTSLRD